MQRARGLQFHELALDEIRGCTTPFGKMYKLSCRLGSFYRYQPRQVRCQIAGKTVSAPPVVHESVVFRMATGFQGYAPIALPRSGGRRQGQPNPSLCRLPEGCRGGCRTLQSDDRNPGYTVGRDGGLAEAAPRHRSDQGGYIPPSRRILRDARSDACLSGVPDTRAAVSEGGAARSELGCDVGGGRQVRCFHNALVPCALANAIAQNPFVAGILAVLAFCSYRRGKSLSIRIADRARAAWSIGHDAGQRVLRPSIVDGLALRLLGSSRAKATWAFTSGKLFSAFAGLLAVLLPAILIDRTLYWLKSSRGEICASQTQFEDLRGVTGQWQNIVFRADDPCVATKFRVRQGRRYELLAVPPKGEWGDAGNEADWTGLNFSKLSWRQALAMYAAAPSAAIWARRGLCRLRALAFGWEEYVLTPADVAEGKKPRETMTSIISPAKRRAVPVRQRRLLGVPSPGLARAQRSTEVRMVGAAPLRQRFRHGHRIVRRDDSAG